MEFDSLSKRVIGAAIDVHRELGPRLLESSYAKCLEYELMQAGIGFSAQAGLPINYKGIKIDTGYRADLVIEQRLIVELKCVEQLSRLHEAQPLTYMKLAEIGTGLLINFNTRLLKTGIKRFVL